MKLVPSTLSANAGPPTITVGGEMELIEGGGLGGGGGALPPPPPHAARGTIAVKPRQARISANMAQTLLGIPGGRIASRSRVDRCGTCDQQPGCPTVGGVWIDEFGPQNRLSTDLGVQPRAPGLIL